VKTRFEQYFPFQNENKIFQTIILTVAPYLSSEIWVRNTHAHRACLGYCIARERSTRTGLRNQFARRVTLLSLQFSVCLSVVISTTRKPINEWMKITGRFEYTGIFRPDTTGTVGKSSCLRSRISFACIDTRARRGLGETVVLAADAALVIRSHPRIAIWRPNYGE